MKKTSKSDSFEAFISIEDWGYLFKSLKDEVNSKAVTAVNYKDKIKVIFKDGSLLKEIDKKIKEGKKIHLKNENDNKILIAKKEELINKIMSKLDISKDEFRQLFNDK